MRLIGWDDLDDLDDGFYTRKQICKQVGLNGRQIARAVEAGVVRPAVDTTGTGEYRKYDKPNVLEFQVYAELRSIGVSCKDIKSIVEAWQDPVDLLHNVYDFKEEFERLRNGDV